MPKFSSDNAFNNLFRLSKIFFNLFRKEQLDRSREIFLIGSIIVKLWVLTKNLISNKLIITKKHWVAQNKFPIDEGILFLVGWPDPVIIQNLFWLCLLHQWEVINSGQPKNCTYRNHETLIPTCQILSHKLTNMNFWVLGPSPWNLLFVSGHRHTLEISNHIFLWDPLCAHSQGAYEGLAEAPN